MKKTEITISGATAHNLKDLSVSIPRGSITVVTGVSGSGKSSLVFDTILAEAQRRFFYTLSHYSRQFLDLGSKPPVKSITGLSPAIALAQNETKPSSRASVGSLTDITELLGILLARFGDAKCPTHGESTQLMSKENLAERIISAYLGQTLTFFAPLAEAKRGTFKAELTKLGQKGYQKVWIDGKVLNLSPIPKLTKETKHTLKLVIDQITIKPQSGARIIRAITTAFAESDGFGEYTNTNDNSVWHKLSSKGGCPHCGYTWSKLDPRHFSPNSLGACETCSGYGYIGEKISDSETCASCHGSGLSPHLSGISFRGHSAPSLHQTSLKDLAEILRQTSNNPAEDHVRKELLAKISEINKIGLGYLSPSRRILSLSGGESQRLKLAGILAESLSGVLYILDEPSQGLHHSEISYVMNELKRLKALGNTVIVVDHDEQIMQGSDWIIDLGPGGGHLGGQILATFKPDYCHDFQSISPTARFLSHLSSPTKKFGQLAAKPERYLTFVNCQRNNLKIPEVKFPIHALSVVAGVSGSGKSSLVMQTLMPAVQFYLSKKEHAKINQINFRGTEVTGVHGIKSIEGVDRSPIGKSSVSNPATYLELFSDLRTLFGSLPDAQVLGLSARDFSIASEGGRCPECKGRGEIDISMRFLADQRISCPSCLGRRYLPHVLTVQYKSLAIDQILNLTLEEALNIFQNHRSLAAKLKVATDLGLGYLKLGQPSSSLSGGEAQRLKLAPYLSRRDNEGALLILDEPTQGLHFDDITKLISALRSIVAAGATVIAIEHNQAFTDHADYVVTLGPSSGKEGGRIDHIVSRFA